ncbi:MAG TPA: FG-GAP-like repeat-containing protein [Vicinamibacterales bacterium]|nr:FG-GAP-like repeat-containing protein [Vicinamibacterales bacterium]
MRSLRVLSALSISLFALGAAAAESAWDRYFATPTVAANLGAATRPFGVAAGDFDGDGHVDLVVGRTTGNVAFVKGNGDGTFAAPVQFTWKLEYFNAWSFAAGDVDGDFKLDVVWSASAAGADSGGVTRVADGDVRVLYGNGNGTFQVTSYVRSGVTFNAGTLLADVGTDAGSVAVGDVDADGDVDVVVGAVDGANTVVRLLRNGGSGFMPSVLITQTNTSDLSEPIYYPAISTQNSPWGLALGDADADGDLDLFVGDRALYVYLYRNDGTGGFTLTTGHSIVSGRPNVYIDHDTYRVSVGYTPTLAAGDVNGDGRADVFVGLHTGAQTPSSNVAHDGEILLNLSSGTGHFLFGSLGDIGTVARGLSLIDVTGDAALDLVGGEYAGTVKLLRQLPPLDTDVDGISDYVDNAPESANAPRLDMNTDGSRNHRDQLDNDFDTVLGSPELPGTWQRLGDPADLDDDNDGVGDLIDNCAFVANASQTDVDGDLVGDACDPLDDRDADSDDVPDGPQPGEPLFDLSLAAKARWASGTTRFVIRIDALGRWFQNEFTQILTDAATLSPQEWATKCWENYEPADFDPPYEPCGDDATQTLTLAGGRSMPVSLVVIPKQLWTDPPVVTWISERNRSRNFEVVQHGTYHTSNTMLGDWADMSDRNFYSCEFCGLTLAESFELTKVGYDTLLGNYGNRWIAESGAAPTSPKIDWAGSFWPLISFSPGYNTSDTTARNAFAQFGFRGFSASWFEEAGSYSDIFSPEGSHHEQFDQFGMFHASADLQVNPPDTTGDTYDTAAYAEYLASKTNINGLTTWLIEEVDWSGRPCPNDDRLGTCNGESNRENNTVYLPRWNAWLQLLDYVKNYPGGVALTIAEVALAKGFDNAPTVANADQADADADGVGDVVDGAALSPLPASLSRNVAGTLSATLANGAGAPIAGQVVTFGFDANGDAEDEQYEATTNEAGLASVTATATRPVGPASFTVAWNGILVNASATGTVRVFDASLIVIDATSPIAGQVTDAVTFGATLTDSAGAPLAGRTLSFQVGAATASGSTDVAGHATAILVLAAPAGATTLGVSFAGDDLYGGTLTAAAFTVNREDTAVTVSDAVAVKNSPAIAHATLKEADGATLAGRTLRFEVQDKVKGQLAWVTIGGAVTDATGAASLPVPARYVNRAAHPLRAVFDGDDSFAGSAAAALVYRD